MTSKTDRDGAVTQYAYDQENDLTNRLMPGGVLTWQATYNNAGQILTEKNVGSSAATTARSDTYAYYSSGSFVGLLQTHTDGRGVACTHTYDDYLRPLTLTYTNSAGGSPPEQSLSTTFGYEVRGMVSIASPKVLRPIRLALPRLSSAPTTRTVFWARNSLP